MQNFIEQALNYIAQHGGAWQDWYVGIAENPRDRLFTDHAVSESGIWIYSQDLGNHANARLVEKYFLDCGCDGGPGGGSDLTKFVYVFKKTRFTLR